MLTYTTLKKQNHVYSAFLKFRKSHIVYLIYFHAYVIFCQSLLYREYKTFENKNHGFIP